MITFSWVNQLSDNWSTIVGSIIQALGAVAAAGIAAFWANRIARGFKFHTYSDAPDNICTILKKARSDIFIVTAVGNKLLRTIEHTLEQKLKDGIHVRYLLLDVNRFHEMEKYLHGNHAKSEDIRNEALDILARLKRKYPDRLEIRFFQYYMTASYIGIDTCPDPARERALLTPFVQIMLYQYRIHAKSSVILYFYEKTDKKYYDATADSMKDMWEDAAARAK